MRTRALFASLLLSLGAAQAAQAAPTPYFTNGVPPAGGSAFPGTIPLTGAEALPTDTMLPSGSPAAEGTTTLQLAGFGRGLAGSGGWRNGLIGGDFGTNLWQRGTGGTATTTVLTYQADRWWTLSGAATEIKQIKETGAGDTPTGFSASARLQRTAGQTGVVESCEGQVLTSANSVRFAGKRVEFSAELLQGADFSGGGQVTLTIGTGTGSDESAAAFSTGSWTGYASTSQTTTISQTWTEYSMVASVPQGVTQIGVKLCFTPSGTAGTNDWVEMAGAQLDSNPAAQGYNGVGASTGVQASFEYRPAEVEARLQQAYFFRLVEPGSGVPVPGSCEATGATSNECVLPLPTQQRVAGTIGITVPGTFNVNIAGTPTALSAPTAGVCSQFACTITGGNTNTAGQVELLTGGGGTGAWDVDAEL